MDPDALRWCVEMVSLLFDPDAVLITGVEDDRETGGVRVYVGARYLNCYSLVVDPETCERARQAWQASHMGHLIGNFQDLWPLHDEGRARSREEIAWAS